MTGKLITVILSCTICGSILFYILSLLQKRLPGGYTSYLYSAMKGMGLGFLFPLPIVSFCVLETYSTYRALDLEKDLHMVTEDFTGARLEGGLKTFNSFSGDMHVSVLAVIVAVWFLVFLCSLTYSSIRSRRLIRRALNEAVECKDWRTKILEEECRSLNVKRAVRLYISDSLKTPGLVGILHPVIIIPEIELSEGGWRLVFRHELTHLKSCDLIYRNLVDVVQKIYWFNPVMNKWGRSFFEMGELACDQLVVKKCTKREKAEYARLLVLLAENSTADRRMAFLAGSNDYHILERRIRYIMAERTAIKGLVRVAISICLVLAFSMVSYASTLGNLVLQDQIVNNVNDSRTYKVVSSVTVDDFEEKQDVVADWEPSLSVGSINPRGITQFDYTVGAQETAVIDTISLKTGMTISITALAEHSEDIFQIGLVGQNGSRKYVDSKDGMVAWRFNIDKDGEYDVYIQGQNKNAQDIRITGTINVN